MLSTRRPGRGDLRVRVPLESRVTHGISRRPRPASGQTLTVLSLRWRGELPRRLRVPLTRNVIPGDVMARDDSEMLAALGGLGAIVLGIMLVPFRTLTAASNL